MEGLFFFLWLIRDIFSFQHIWVASHEANRLSQAYAPKSEWLTKYKWGVWTTVTFNLCILLFTKAIKRTGPISHLENLYLAQKATELLVKDAAFNSL